MTPYYSDDFVTLYHGVWWDYLPLVGPRDVMSLVTDPPYPNNAGHFTDDVDDARELLENTPFFTDAIVFWSELEQPPVPLPLVAVHVWHRANVNGRPWEAVYHFDERGVKRRSEVMRHAAIFEGAGPGCAEYLGHPTQKPVALMRRLIELTHGVVIVDPFAGSGSSLRAAKDAGRRAIGIEREERYCEIAAERCAQEVLDLEGAA